MEPWKQGPWVAHIFPPSETPRGDGGPRNLCALPHAFTRLYDGGTHKSVVARGRRYTRAPGLGPQREAAGPRIGSKVEHAVQLRPPARSRLRSGRPGLAQSRRMLHCAGLGARGKRTRSWTKPVRRAVRSLCGPPLPRVGSWSRSDSVSLRVHLQRRLPGSWGRPAASTACGQWATRASRVAHLGGMRAAERHEALLLCAARGTAAPTVCGRLRSPTPLTPLRHPPPRKSKVPWPRRSMLESVQRGPNSPRMPSHVGAPCGVG